MSAACVCVCYTRCCELQVTLVTFDIDRPRPLPFQTTGQFRCVSIKGLTKMYDGVFSSGSVGVVATVTQ
jgi:hypothetical protein